MENTPPTIEALTEDDAAALAREVRLGQKLFDFYYDREWDGSIRDIDKLLSDWQRDPRESIPSPNDISLGLGSLVGEFLRDKYVLRWVIVTDQFGCSLGMIDDQNGWQFFPRDWIAKRLRTENDEADVVATLISGLIESGTLPPTSEQAGGGQAATRTEST